MDMGRQIRERVKVERLNACMALPCNKSLFPSISVSMSPLSVSHTHYSKLICNSNLSTTDFFRNSSYLNFAKGVGPGFVFDGEKVACTALLLSQL